MEVVPEVPSGMASSHVCSLDSAKATGTGHAPLEQREKNQKKKGCLVPSYHHTGSCR